MTTIAQTRKPFTITQRDIKTGRYWVQCFGSNRLQVGAEVGHDSEALAKEWAAEWKRKQAAAEAIEIAARCSTWGAMASSAALCLDDAVSLINRDQHAYAYARALDSLRYSVGIFGEAYKAAKALN